MQQDERTTGTAREGGKPAYMTGIQALVQLPMLQRARDLAAGRNTAGFISGYRGSPLGSVDQALWKAQKKLTDAHVVFQPGLNEELAMTAVWGSQQVNLFQGAKYDGVFAMWYGKGPGLDRSVDVLKHGNAAGSSAHGGVLVVVGDDHGAKSSTLPHQSDHVFSAAMVPVLNPSNVQEFIDFGLHGWAMSRFSGCWVGMRAIADTVETSSSIYLDPGRINPVTPTDVLLPADGVNIRWPDRPLEQEYRLHHAKIYSAIAYARANGLNRIVLDSPSPRLGIITTGKSYLDVRQALAALGIDDETASAIGLRVLKVGMTWPLDPEGVRAFAAGLEEVLVVEEKRQVLEYQLKEELYNWREDVRPRVLGKFDDSGEWASARHWQLPAAGELTPAMIARVIAARIARFHGSETIRDRLAFLEEKEAALAQPRTGMARVPHYCSGCPHNTSTRVPEGSRALAGIGCHYMATWLDPEHTQTFTQMGGEGVPWVGQAPFTETRHVFANLGDGTYTHSGILAIRQAVAAGVNITYKILYNDAVAMTGGQPAEGSPTVAMIVRQVQAENVRRVVVVTDQTEKYLGGVLPRDVTVYERHALDHVQRDLRETPGVTVLVYDQTCAAEKRRRRKRGEYPDPAMRMVINERVCEGCGDCSRASNCMSVAPLETEFGRKREIDQSSCNKDFSCVDGFCPSFVTVRGGRLRNGRAPSPGGLGSAGGLAGGGGLEAPETRNAPAPEPAAESLPAPALPVTDKPYGIMVTGVGGTGVVTIGALLGTAAALEGRHASALDMAGLAQKGGPVWSHIRISDRQDQLFASRIAAGEADLVLGCDIVTAVADESLGKMRAGFTHAVLNSDFSVTSDFVRGFASQAVTGDVSRVRDPQFPLAAMERQVAEAVGPGRMHCLPATRIATALMGDSIATNLLMLGFAWQKGYIPLREESLMRAIEKNGAAVEMNKTAFRWGRRAALDLEAVEQAATPALPPTSSRVISGDLDSVIARRVADLTEYQNRAYADRYAALVARARAAEQLAFPGETGFTEAVARYLYKLMAIKDEYEVARLYTRTSFIERTRAMFEGDARLYFNLAPPILGRRDKVTGAPRKQEFGPWMLHVFRLLAGLRGLRGTALDLFGRTEERRQDRAILREYEALIGDLCGRLDASNRAVTIELAALPEQIRGFGHVRARHIAHALQRRRELIDQLNGMGVTDRPADTSVRRSRSRVVMAG
jgi:indolepyruvate ferredoxin oxidoreductase